MDHNGFWSLIEDARFASGGDCARQVDALAEALQGHPPQAILDFRNTLGELLDRAYRYDLWGACYLINGGCSDDGLSTSLVGSSRKAATSTRPPCRIRTHLSPIPQWGAWIRGMTRCGASGCCRCTIGHTKLSPARSRRLSPMPRWRPPPTRPTPRVRTLISRIRSRCVDGTRGCGPASGGIEAPGQGGGGRVDLGCRPGTRGGRRATTTWLD